MDYNYYGAPVAAPYMQYPPTPAHSAGHSNDEYSGSGSPDLSPQPINAIYDFTATYDTGVPPGVSQVSMMNGAGIPTTAGPLMLDAMDVEQSRRARSSSEEKEPKQNRRKEQNRAAQRAFRERKERHVKELETQLSQLKSSSSNFLAENEALKQQLQRLQVENEIMRANGPAPPVKEGSDMSVGPMQYTPTEFYANLLQPHTNKHPSHRVTFSPTTGERLLGAGATWDMIYNHPLFQQGLVDPAEVCDKLKHMAKCDGQGPVFEEGLIRQMIEESAGSGRDELI